MNNIALYLPSTIYGGTEILMTRLADFLATNEKNVTIYTKVNSSILQHYTPSENVKLAFDIDNIKNTKLIISSKYIVEVSNLIKDNRSVNIYIWQLQPIELISQFFPARRFDRKIPIYDRIIDFLYLGRRKKLALILSEYHKSNSLFFMDKENYNKTNAYINLDFEHPSFIPVAIPFKETKQKNHIDSQVKKFCVVSRISFDFKFYAIKNFIFALNEYSKEYNKEIEVHIVGDGDALVELTTYTMTLSIKCIFHGFVSPKKVRTDIFPRIDVYFGMGTSLIDSSMYRIPSIITNISNKYTNHQEIKYSLLYESDGYILGSYDNIGKHTFNDLISRIIMNNKHYGDLCYFYAKKHHSANEVFNKLQKLIFENNHCKYNFDEVIETSLFIDIFFKKLKTIFKILHLRKKY